jgi:hypothetical protein
VSRQFAKTLIVVLRLARTGSNLMPIWLRLGRDRPLEEHTAEFRSQAGGGSCEPEFRVNGLNV